MSRARRTRDVNPALKIRDFYSFGMQILNQINYARMYPNEFVEKLEELNNTIPNDNCLYIDGVPFLYSNLKESLEDAINFLSNQNPLPGLVYNKTITQACDYLLDELIIHDGLDDENSNKYSLENRLSKFGEPLGETYELIDYGMFDPEFIVINFILCDGDNQKYERNVIFNSKIKCLGIASAILPSEKVCTVINFCEEFFDKYEQIPLEVQMKYKKSVPKYTTKTIKSYSNQVEGANLHEENYIDDNFNNYNFKRRNSGKVFNMKKNQYIQRRNSIKQMQEQGKNNQQRGGTISMQPKVNKAGQKKDDDEEEDFRDDRFIIRRRRTIHEPKMEVISEEKHDNDDEIKGTSQSRRNNNYPSKNYGKVNKYNNQSSNTNSTVETKYYGDKKVTTRTTTTTTGGDGYKKTVTTTVTEEIGGGVPPGY
jgi:hypothetical protein